MRKTFRDILIEATPSTSFKAEGDLFESEPKVLLFKGDKSTQYISLTSHGQDREEQDSAWWEKGNFDDPIFSDFGNRCLRRLKSIHDKKNSSIEFKFRGDIGFGQLEEGSKKPRKGFMGSLRMSMSQTVQEYTSFAIVTILNADAERAQNKEYIEFRRLRPDQIILLNPLKSKKEATSLLKTLTGNIIIDIENEENFLKLMVTLKENNFDVDDFTQLHEEGNKFIYVNLDDKFVYDEKTELPKENKLDVYKIDSVIVNESKEIPTHEYYYLEESKKIVPFIFI
jgi:hypothetical protein